MFYTTLIILLFSLTVNVFYFYTWTSHSKWEIEEIIVWEYNQSYINWSFWSFKDSILKRWWAIVTNDSKIFISSWYLHIPKTNIFGIFEKNWRYFELWSLRLDAIWTVYIFYDTFSLYESQKTLFKISLILVIVFMSITYFASKILITRSLRRLHSITKFANELDFNNLWWTQLSIDWPDDDEIKTIAIALNESITRLSDKAAKLKEFSSDVAHEFKTSLMIMNSELDYCIATDKWAECLTDLKIQVKFLDHLINSLLSLTRLDKNKLDKKFFNFSELVSKIANDISRIFVWKNIKLVLNIKNNIDLVANLELISIVVSNLIFNAYKYTNSWKIEISLDSKSLKISDTWIWIEKTLIDKIWDRHYSSATSDNKIASHWLWLALVKEIIDRHWYRIEIKSKPNVGTAFLIFFDFE